MPFVIIAHTLSIAQEQTYSKMYSLTKTQKAIPIPAAITDNPNPAPTVAKNLTSCDSSLLKNIANRSIQIEFDPTVIPYQKILDVFWHTRDPTILNRQGNDVGTHYRLQFFYHDQKQKEIAEKSKRDLEKAVVYKNPVVTEITPFKNFYVAEDYHKDYYEKHQNASYCSFAINPKVHKLIQKYGNDLKDRYK